MTAVVEDGLRVERHVGAVLTAVAVAARAVALVCAVISVAIGLHERQFGHVPVALAAYAVVMSWSLAYLAHARGGPPPLWASKADVVVLSFAMVAIRYAGRPDYFNDVSNSDLEPFVSAALVGVAIHASGRQLAAACGVLGTVYMGTVTTSGSATEIGNAFGDLAWQIGIAVVCLIGAVRLYRAAAAVEAGARSVVRERERLAETRGRDLERHRHLQARRRRQLELHDGPLALLTAMSRPAPVGHPDVRVRERCAANADLLRSLLGEQGVSATEESPPELRLALVEAGADCAALGLRVRYQFGPLPQELPEAVVDALCGATRAALNNVLAHAGTRSAWVTAQAQAVAVGGAAKGGLGAAGGQDAVAVGGAADVFPQAVTVDIVDRGVGFDPGATAPRVGLPTAIAGRMAAVGGAGEVDSAAGEGTWVRLRWPA